MASHEYENLYGVALLDDLHNYFPALLYDSTSFTNVQQVLYYLQTQTRQRFDLYTRGLHGYRGARPRVAATFQARAGPFYTPAAPESVNIHTRVMRGLNQTDDLLNLFTAVLGAPMTFSNVIVRPSREQINTSTAVTTLTAITTDICAICQDGYGIGNERRELNACHHIFHKACIDTWFQENVHCPVCRHDIREPASAAAASAASVPPTATPTD
jgi:hypothetical protein